MIGAQSIHGSISPLFIPLNNVLQDLREGLSLRFHPKTNFVEPDQQIEVNERRWKKWEEESMISACLTSLHLTVFNDKGIK